MPFFPMLNSDAHVSPKINTLTFYKGKYDVCVCVCGGGGGGGGGG